MTGRLPEEARIELYIFLKSRGFQLRTQYLCPSPPPIISSSTLTLQDRWASGLM